MKIRTLVGILLLAPALSLLGDTSKGKAAPEPKSSCTTARSSAHPRPEALREGLRAPRSQQGYEIATKIPATLDKIHCFCECAESPMFRHKTLLTCFTTCTPRAAGSACPRRGWPAQLKEKGVSDEEIVVTVESVHRTDGHPRRTH